MTAVWPLTLPQKINVSGNQETIPDGRLRSQTDTGPGKMRPRTSALGRPFAGSMYMTEAQTLILDSFVSSDTAKGTLPFTFPAQRGGGTWLVRFGQTLPGYVNIAPDIWEATLALEILP